MIGDGKAEDEGCGGGGGRDGGDGGNGGDGGWFLPIVTITTFRPPMVYDKVPLHGTITSNPYITFHQLAAL